MKKKITFNWKERTINEGEKRVGAMYCFSRCEINQN